MNKRKLFKKALLFYTLNDWRHPKNVCDKCKFPVFDGVKDCRDKRIFICRPVTEIDGTQHKLRFLGNNATEAYIKSLSTKKVDYQAFCICWLDNDKKV